uniref:Putative secreted protein n=1 Tax=Ixodes ricinus TaxID=34613 RepID=A0A6B0UAT0_IXORI
MAAATRLFCIFMASMTQTSWFSPTMSPTLTDTSFTSPGMGASTTLLVSSLGFSGIWSRNWAASLVSTVTSSAMP